MLIRSIGSICTAVLSFIGHQGNAWSGLASKRSGNENATLTLYAHSTGSIGEFVPGWEPLVLFPQLSIATKLYVIFALLATMTVGLAAVAVHNAHRHAALTDDFESAYAGAINVQRVDALIYAVVMESRGIYMSPDVKTAKAYGDGLLAYNDRISKVVDDWRKSVRAEDATCFEPFAGRLQQFQDFRRELVRRGIEIGPPAGREWGDNDANRSVRKALNADIEALGEHYAKRSRQIYTEIDQGIDSAAWLMTLLAGCAVLLAVVGMLIIWRWVARPLASTPPVTEPGAAAGPL